MEMPQPIKMICNVFRQLRGVGAEKPSVASTLLPEVLLFLASAS